MSRKTLGLKTAVLYNLKKTVRNTTKHPKRYLHVPEWFRKAFRKTRGGIKKF